jgi:hypothetical protein
MRASAFGSISPPSIDRAGENSTKAGPNIAGDVLLSVARVRRYRVHAELSRTGAPPLSHRRLQLQAFAALSILLAAIGCQTTTKATFNVSLHNASTEPVTVWLTKSGGPEENAWLPPEALAHSRAADIDAVNGVIIPAGKTGDIGPLTGRFEPDSVAVLRVYAGQVSLDQMLATPVDGKLRIDMPLREGVNKLQVSALLPLRIDRLDEAP